MRALNRIPGGVALITTALLSVLLAGCGAGAGAAASATATATCPPVPAVKSVTGHITAVSGGNITVTDASGAATTVAIPATLRVSRRVTVAPTALAAGTQVLVLTDTNATVARLINVIPQGVAATGTPGANSGGFGGFGPGGRGSGTPTAGRNRGCFQRAGQGSRQGQPGQGSGFQGLRGTVDSASSTRLVFDDTQGQTYSVAINSATIIQQTAQAQVSDLTVGKTVMVTGSVAASGAITARTVVIQG